MCGQQIVVACRLCVLVQMLIQKPCQMFSLPSPWVVYVPAFGYCYLNDFRLAKVTLAGGVRPRDDPRQEKLHIECRAHIRPPM